MTSTSITVTEAGPVRARRTSDPLQRASAFASIVQALTYLVGFAAMAAYLAPRGFIAARENPSGSLEFLLENQVAMYLWYLVLYLVGGAALVVLTLGIHDRLRGASPAMAQIATAFGLIWSGLLLASGMVALVGQRSVVDLATIDRGEAVTTWSSLSVVQDALGGGIEVVGAIWVLLVGIAALRTAALPRGLAALGLAVGVAGLWTLVPQVEVAAVFGLGFIVWFLWAGRALSRGVQPDVASAS